MEAVHADVPKAAQGPSVKRRHERLGGIFDEDQTASLGEGPEDVDRAGNSGIVDRQYGAGPRSNGRLDRVGIDVEGIGQDVDEDGRGAPERDRIGARHKCEGRHDHLVAGTEFQNQRRELEPRSGRGGKMDEREASLGRDQRFAPACKGPVRTEIALRKRLTKVVELVPCK